VKPLPKESLAAFANGNRLPAALSTGQRVTFCLVTGAGEVRASKFLKQNSASVLSAALATRIVSIEGVDTDDAAAKMAFINDLDFAEVTGLMAQFDALDGGIETTVRVACVKCDAEVDAVLPFDRAFWMPKAKAKTASPA